MIESVGAVSESVFDDEYQSREASSRISRLNDSRGMADDAQADTRLGSSSLFDAQIWMSRAPWQPAAGWSVMAALLTWVPLTEWFGTASIVDWRLIALVLLLVDPLWGSVWRFSAGRSAVLPLQSHVLRRRFWLPYMSADSPAARLMGGGVSENDRAGDNRAQDVYPVLLRVALPSVLLALAVAAVLGASAVWMTCVVVLLSVLGWTNYSSARSRKVNSQQRRGSYFLQALVTVALPWALVLLLMSSSSDSLSGADSMLGSGAMRFSWILLVLWTVHGWGEGRCLQSTTDRLGIALLAISNLGMAILLITLGMPIGLGILAVIWFATWFSIFNGSLLKRVQGWWLLAMLISAASVGFS